MVGEDAEAEVGFGLSSLTGISAMSTRIALLALGLFLDCFICCATYAEPNKLNGIAEQELRGFAKDFAASIRAKDHEAILAAIDCDTMVASILESLAGEEAKFQALRDALIARYESPQKNLVCNLAKNQQDVRINGYELGAQPTFDVRFLVEPGPVYLKLLVQKDSGGKIKIVDFKNELTGEFHSKIHRNGLLFQANDLKLKLTNTASKQDQLILQHGEKLAEIQLAFAKQDFDSVKKAYENLPPEVQDNKYLRTLFLLSLVKSNQSDKLQLEADKFRRDFPNNSSILHFDIDAAYFRKDYPKFLQLLEKLEAVTDNDPLILDRKVDGYVGLQDYPKAMQAINQAIQQLPHVEGLYFTRVVVASNLSEYQIMLDDLRKLSKEFGYDLADSVETNPVYKGFRTSKQHAEWKEFLNPQKK